MIPSSAAELSFEHPSPDTLVLRIGGRWRLEDSFPSVSDVEQQLDADTVRHVAFDASGLEEWHSGLAAFLLQAPRLKP